MIGQQKINEFCITKTTISTIQQMFQWMIHWIIEKAREFQKNIYFCFIDYAKPLSVWITTNFGKFLKRWEYQTTLPTSWETCMQDKKQQLESDMEHQ